MHVSFTSICPFIGISAISFYWIFIFYEAFLIRPSVACYPSSGYRASKPIYRKSQILDLVQKCLAAPSFYNTSFCVSRNDATFILDPTGRQVILPDFIGLEFDQLILNTRSLWTTLKISVKFSRYQFNFSRIVKMDRQGMVFYASQTVDIDNVVLLYSHVFPMSIGVISFILILIRPASITSYLSILPSIAAIVLHTFYFGRWIAIFRFVVTLAWIIEAFNMLDIQYRSFVVFIPLFILVVAFATLLHGLFADDSKYMRDLPTSIITTTALMVGDHIFESFSSFYGNMSWSLALRIGFLAVCVATLAYVVFLSIDKPLARVTGSTFHTAEKSSVY